MGLAYFSTNRERNNQLLQPIDLYENSYFIANRTWIKLSIYGAESRNFHHPRRPSPAAGSTGQRYGVADAGADGHAL